MRKSKVYYLTTGMIISVLYGILISVVFSNIHNKLVGLPSGVISTGILFLAFYHFLDYLVYRKYNQMIKKGTLFSESEKLTSFTTRQTLNQSYDILINIAARIQGLRVIEKFDDLNIIIISVESGFKRWGTLIFISIEDIKGAFCRVKMNYLNLNEKENLQKEASNYADNLISQFKALDILDTGHVLN
ncbi:MAG: hypothetical protein WCZ17_04415 [Candidatus Kapaibacterium sp.]|jgi:hypothetical protein|nr:hypothetical protein [Candidatus Kapabacteria bacterium]